MDYLTVVVIVVPAVIGLAALLALGINRGLLMGAAGAIIAVFVLLLFQVSPPPASGPGSETGRSGYAFGLMKYEALRWIPAFLVGAAVGAVIARSRRRV